MSEPSVVQPVMPDDRRASSLSDPRRLRTVVIAAGMAAAVVALAVPWYQLALKPDLRASRLRPVLGAWTPPAWGNWATIVIVLVAVHGLCQHTPVAKTMLGQIAGRVSAWMVFFVPLVSLVQTRYADAATLHTLLTDSAAFRAFGREVPYSVGTSPLSSVFDLHLSRQWQLTIDAIGPGLLLLVAAGAVMVWTTTPQRAAMRDAALSVRLGKGALVFSLILLLFGAQSVAYVLRNSALDSVQRGDYVAGRRTMSEALRWNPGLVENDDVVSGLALMSLSESGPHTAAALVGAADIYAHANAGLQQLDALMRAHRAAPRNAVITDELVLAATRRAFTDKDPGEVLELPADLRSLDLVQYTLGRIYYLRYDDANARRALIAAAASASNDDLKSSAWTYAALADARMGNQLAARDDIERALAFNGDLRNSQAAAYATGLYVIAR